MEKSGIVMGSHAPEKRERAREMRRKMTRTEAILWHRVRANRLGGLQFRRQQVIDGFIADFYCHAAGLVIEVDGPIHDDQAEYDSLRDCIIEARGLRVLRFTNTQIENELESVLARILQVAKDSIPDTK